MASDAAVEQAVNPWEVQALNYDLGRRALPKPEPALSAKPARRQVRDPMIYPGLYSASGFDIMTILLQVLSRPHPQIQIGAVDCSVALILCDLQKPDTPTVYASDSFCELTGYTRAEILGRNCRFLQTPGGGAEPKGFIQSISDRNAIRRLGHAVRHQEEVQIDLTNYKKNGQKFTNSLSVIPVSPGPSGYHYAVGLLAELI